MNVEIISNVYNRLSDYSVYLIQNGKCSRQRTHEKVDYIVNEMIHKLSNEQSDGRLCPYWNFSGAGRGYRMIQIKDKWTRSTVWDVAYENKLNEPTRVVRGLELDSVLASKDKIVYPPYQMTLPLDERRLSHIIRQIIREQFSRPRL